MRKSLRRVRGAIGMGLTWGAAWCAAGIMLAVVTRFKADAPFPLIFGVLGFIAGVIFSAILALAEGRRRFDQMSLPRFAVWGATGGLLLSPVFAKAASLGWGDVLVIAPTFAIACAVCASGSLAVARRARPQLRVFVSAETYAAQERLGILDEAEFRAPAKQERRST
jgi:FtsH-binding integral membrane protein